ncbi:transporter substrate-binding domain-containing protein [uncultured Nostoc sp.]|uniref:transporter substrate-binding domain-containing protein n=1 Tax=uncultured Nostoc sp. TaxID=340711 RepID=UPI0035CC2934
MKLNYRLSITLNIIILLFNFSGLAQQKTFIDNQGKVTKPKTYYFGLRKTSAPISYRDGQDGQWKGYCYALVETLNKNKNTSLDIKPVEMEREDRFTGKNKYGQKLDAECGPNTITPERKQLIKKNNLDGEFSDTFAWTGTAALLLKENEQKLAPGNELKKLKFGVIKGTTTAGIVYNTYPSLDKENKKLVFLEDNQDGITKLKEGDIDVYFNDQIILLSLLKKLNESSKQEYFLKPGLISNEEYGVIVYHTNESENQQLLQAINSLLQTEFQTFENTLLKILDNSDFHNFLTENNLIPSNVSSTPDPITELYIWIKTNFFWILAISIIFLSSFLWWFKNYRIKSTEQLEMTGTRENNHPLSSKNPNANADLTKSESSLAPVNVIYIKTENSHSHTGKDHMPSNNNFNQSNANINAGVQGTNEGNSTQQFVQNIYTSEQKQNLDTFAKDVQRILEKIDKNKPNATKAEKQNIVSYEIPPDQRSKIVRAFKAGGEKALEEFLDNPYLNVAIAIVKEWQKEE